MSAADDRARNRGDLEEIQRRLAAVRDKLATVVAEAGPLFREVGELSDRLDALLARSKPPTTPESEARAQAAMFSEDDELTEPPE